MKKYFFPFFLLPLMAYAAPPTNIRYMGASSSVKSTAPLSSRSATTVKTTSFKPSTSITATRAAATPNANSRLSISSLIKPNVPVVQTPGIGNAPSVSGDADLSEVNDRLDALESRADNTYSVAEIDAALENIENSIAAGGLNGADGKSAYEIAVENGFVGTEAAWLDSLKGTDASLPIPTTGDGLYLLRVTGASTATEKVNINDTYGI